MQIWAVLIRETRDGRAEQAGPGYQAEAFLALAGFSEACCRDATGLTDTPKTDGAAVDDRLSRLLRLILPNGVAASQSGEGKKGAAAAKVPSAVNPEMSESELELGIWALGIMWPLQPKQVHGKNYLHSNYSWALI